MSEPRVTIIANKQGFWRLPDLAEIWRYRELFWVLAGRDIRVRYKQTALGAAWAIIQPFFTMVALTAISHFGHFSTDGVPPPVFYYCGMLPWLLFANAVASSGGSLLGNQHLITKVYFPRVVVPASSVITSVVDFAVAFTVLLVLMAYYRVAPAPQIVLLPLFVALGFLAALGFGLWVSALTVQFRDVRHVIPFLLQLWLFCTPVLYASSSVHDGRLRLLLALNPVSGVVEGVRWSVLGQPAGGPPIALSTALILFVLVSSIVYFQHVERTLADRL
jgi:lipopolysaccharide transport system permease protein